MARTKRTQIRTRDPKPYSRREVYKIAGNLEIEEGPPSRPSVILIP